MAQLNNSLARMRTLDQIMVEINACDAQSCITKHYVRSLVLKPDSPIRTVLVGRKRLIDLDSVIAAINDGYGTSTKPQPAEPGTVRRVDI